MPTSVLLAVLAAAGLLALAPALVRRYDATERLVAERAQSTARVLSRTRRRRSVPGRRPVNASRVLVPTLRAAAPVSPAPPYPTPGADSPSRVDRPGRVDRQGRVDRTSRRVRVPGQDRRVRVGSDRARVLSVAPRSAPPARRPPRYSPAVYRRRRVFAALILLNLVELVGVVTVGPGFWVGFAVTGTLLAAFVVHLRNLALADQRRRRDQARREAWLASRQAAVRREQARRAAARREAVRRMAGQRESLRRAAAAWYEDPPADPGVDGPRTAGTVSYRRAGALRGRPYDAGGPARSA